MADGDYLYARVAEPKDGGDLDAFERKLARLAENDQIDVYVVGEELDRVAFREFLGALRPGAVGVAAIGCTEDLDPEPVDRDTVSELMTALAEQVDRFGGERSRGFDVQIVVWSDELELGSGDDGSDDEAEEGDEDDDDGWLEDDTEDDPSEESEDEDTAEAQFGALLRITRLAKAAAAAA